MPCTQEREDRLDQLFREEQKAKDDLQDWKELRIEYSYDHYAKLANDHLYLLGHSTVGVFVGTYGLIHAVIKLVWTWLSDTYRKDRDNG